jgi:glutamine phosphoribosylpyrophosphate amidotransferase
MCAIVGAVIQNPTTEHFDMIKRVFIESKIRGMHATGIAYTKNGEVHIDKRPVPADEFPFDFKEYINEDGNLYMIGHCRYSTSDLEFNQPIGDNTSAIAHNGVITQELPENWETLYGYKTMTKNDSELVWHSENPLSEFSHMSMAVCKIDWAKRLHVYRNGKRPLYLTKLDDGCIITSTADVAKRANLNHATTPVPMNTYLTFETPTRMSVNKVDIEGAVDYQ